jgi:molecular chaperone DnaK (HSP70)
MLHLDICPHSIGLDTAGGVMTTLIPRKTAIPMNKSQIFSTYLDNQEKVMIHVYEGERSMTRDNRLLGKFEVFDIPKMPRGRPQVEVVFRIDASGIVSVFAMDKNTGTLYNIRTRAIKDRLTREEISAMRENLAKLLLLDREMRERISAEDEMRRFSEKV